MNGAGANHNRGTRNPVILVILCGGIDRKVKVLICVGVASFWLGLVNKSKSVKSKALCVSTMMACICRRNDRNTCILDELIEKQLRDNRLPIVIPSSCSISLRVEMSTSNNNTKTC